MKAITPKVAGIVAIRLLQHKYARRGLELNPEIISAKMKELEKETGYDSEFIRTFFFKWILPNVLRACGQARESLQISDPNTVEIEGAENRLAILLFAKEHAQINGISETIQKLSKGSNVTNSEIHAFYWQYVFPLQLRQEYVSNDIGTIKDFIISGIAATEKT